MAVRRIGTLEQNIEKIALGVCGAAFLGVLAWQFLPSSRTTVTVPVSAKQSAPVPVGDAYDVVADRARQLKAEMGTRELPNDFPKVASVGLLDEFGKGKIGPITSGKQLAVKFGELPPSWVPKIKPGDTPPPPGQEIAFAEPKLPAIDQTCAKAFVASISNDEVAASPELAAAVPAAEPHNKGAVSVQGVLNGQKLRDALAADPDGSGPLQALPPAWWDGGRTNVLIVQLEREELVDGNWTDHKVLPPAPARFTLLNRLKDVKGIDQMTELLNDAAAHTEEIQRPEWYQRPDVNGVPIGEEWVAPCDDGAADAAATDKAQKEKALRTKVKKRTDMQKNLDDLRRRSPGGGRPGPGGGGRQTPGGGGSDNTREIESLDKQIKKLDAEIKKLRDELGVKEKPKVDTNQSGNILEDQAIQLWAHDVTAVRGKTYRYQMSVQINNPMFRKANVSQQELATKVALQSAPSGWTDGVEVPPEAFYFITSATDRDQGPSGGALGHGVRASAELFTFDWGYWRRGVVNLDAGDALIARAEIPDIEKLRALAPARPAPGGPGMPGKGPGGFPARNPAPAAPEQPAADEGKDKGPLVKKVDISIDAFLLDVAVKVSAAKEKDAYQVYLRDTDGQVVIRDPAGERIRDKYKEVLRSAKEGEERNQTLREEITGKPREEKRPGVKPPDEMAPPPPPPGGGGGGGG